MVVLGQIEWLGVLNLGDDWPVEFPAGRQLLLGVLGDPPLHRILDEDHRSVIVTAILELPHRIGWVGLVPVDFNQVRVGDDIGIEGDPDRLGVPGCSGTNLLIGGVGHVAAGVSRLHLLDPRVGIKRLDHAPEAAAREDCRV